MPGMSRLGDLCSGHGCFPQRPSITASDDVFINDIPAHRVGDLWDVHSCVSSHDGVTIQGSPDVFINDQPAARIGDMIDCGSYVLEGSEDVLANE